MIKQFIKDGLKKRKPLFLWAGWFTFLNALFLLFIIANYVKFMEPAREILGLFYLVLVLIGQPFIIAYCVCAIIFLPIIFVWPNRLIVKSVGILAATFGISLAILDYIVYSQYRFHLSGVIIDLIVGGGAEIFNFSWRIWMIGILSIIGILMLQCFFSWFVSRKMIDRKRAYLGYISFLVVLLAILTSNMLHAWADVNFYRPVTSLTRHIPLFYPMTAKRFLQRHGFVNLAVNREKSKLKFVTGSRGTLRYPIQPLNCSEQREKKNILFIVIDAWRFDMLTQQVTPNIHRFVTKRPTLNFTNHMSGGNGTRIGVFSLFYGLFGTYWNVMSNEQIGPVFISELQRQNYELGIFASAKLTTPPFNRTIFQDVSNLRSFSKGEHSWQRDKNALDEWGQWLEKRDEKRPFFSFLFFDAIHSYSIPPDYPVLFKPMWEWVDYLALNNEFDPTPYRNRYKLAAHYIDSLVAKALAELEYRGLLNNTVIVFTGDHGQEFNDNKRNFWGHGGNYTKYQIQVPLVISWPGSDEKTFNHLTTHLDVVPTLMTDLLGCQNPPLDYSNGHHLFDRDGRDWIVLGGYFNQAILERDRITVTYSTGNYEILDLTNDVIKDAKLNLKVVKAALDEMSRFYKN